MLFCLLVANITISLCFFFLFRVFFQKIFIIPVDNENARLKLSLAFPAGAPLAVTNDAIKIPPPVADNTIKDLSK